MLGKFTFYFYLFSSLKLSWLFLFSLTLSQQFFRYITATFILNHVPVSHNKHYPVLWRRQIPHLKQKWRTLDFKPQQKWSTQGKPQNNHLWHQRHAAPPIHWPCYSGCLHLQKNLVITTLHSKVSCQKFHMNYPSMYQEFSCLQHHLYQTHLSCVQSGGFSNFLSCWSVFRTRCTGKVSPLCEFWRAVQVSI